MEPAYAFTIPSIEDETVLDCRIYHPKGLNKSLSNDRLDSHAIKGAVVAHPYAPLGGCYDDPVVMAVVGCLLKEDHVVGTFNFRGASGSHGRTSWTGNGEKEDYVSFAGFVAYYVHHLNHEIRCDAPQNLPEGIEQGNGASGGLTDTPAHLLLAGYSYGSLILSKLPRMSTILQRFEVAEMGSNAAEIRLRARHLAIETSRALHETQSPLVSRGRRLQVDDVTISPEKHRPRPSPVTVGGEETDPSQRRHSRDSRDSHHGSDIIRKSVEMPHRIKAHMQRRNGTGKSTPGVAETSSDKASVARVSTSELTTVPRIQARYLLISPLLPPLSHALATPSSMSSLFGRHNGSEDATAGFGSHEWPALAIWGSNDNFTSSRRLKTWAEKLASHDTHVIQWSQIEGAGHFWRERGVMKQLLLRITDWVRGHS